MEHGKRGRAEGHGACGQLRNILGIQCDYERYDERWFMLYHPEDKGNEWVKGAPDYTVRISENQFFYTEIKIKREKFRKTLHGGMTERGTLIQNYGCMSYYLDRVPVYRNMTDFSQKTGIPAKNFLLLFVDPETDSIRAISLTEINKLIRNGYNGGPICEIQEGYGKNVDGERAPSYLIPERATHGICPEDADYFRSCIARDLVTPCTLYACNPWFYHKDRSCGYIISKSDSELTVFVSEQAAQNTNRKPCRSCGGGPVQPYSRVVPLSQ